MAVVYSKSLIYDLDQVLQIEAELTKRGIKLQMQNMNTQMCHQHAKALVQEVKEL